MQWIVLADVHGSVRHLPRIVPELCRAAGVFIAGDITNFGGRRDAERVIDSIASANENILAVAGNCDPQDVDLLLDEKEMSLHGRVHKRDGLCCAGINGVLHPSQGVDTLRRLGEQIDQACTGPGDNLVLVSHQPAYGTAVDAARGGRFCGSRALRQFIETVEPILAVSGHIHEAAGVDRLGRTTLVNPGPFRSGHYAVVDIDQDELKVKLKRASD